MKCICEYCNKQYIYTRNGSTTKKCGSCLVNRRRFALKLKCIEYLGGQCNLCGYSKNPYAMDFHHRDPSTKSFNISGNHSLSWNKIKIELDKCDLLCANCHRETYGVTSVG